MSGEWVSLPIPRTAVGTEVLRLVEVQTITDPALMPPLPKFLQIEPVGQCNLKCQMCPVTVRTDLPGDGRPAFMRYEDFLSLIDQFPHLEELQLQGMGEPMMHPRFFDMVAHAVSKGIRVTTNSNLTLLNEQRARRCVTSGLHTLNVSIDGATAGTYEDIRVGSSFPRLLGNLVKVRAAQESLGCSRPLVRLVVVLMRKNLHELPDIVRLAARYRISCVFVQHLGQDFHEPTLPSRYQPLRQFVEQETLVGQIPHDIEAVFQRARQTAADLDIELRLPSPHREPLGSIPDREGKPCDWPWTGAYVTYQGFAVPCCMIATPDRLHMGNVFEQGVMAVWHGASYASFRQRLLSVRPPEVCSSCSIYKHTF